LLCVISFSRAYFSFSRAFFSRWITNAFVITMYYFRGFGSYPIGPPTTT
jgi:hypothetical protein